MLGSSFPRKRDCVGRMPKRTAKPARRAAAGAAR